MTGEFPAPGRAQSGAAFGRRGFLLGSISALALAACSPDRPPGVVTPSTAPPNLPKNSTVSDLLSTKPFYIAHRGSGDNWVEHTLEAYSHSVAIGSRAIEISVNATSDGVLVCHHDQTTERMSTKVVTIADTSFKDLSAITNDAREWLGPRARPQPIPRLVDVLDLYAKSHVIFIEDKQGTNTEALLDLMDKYPNSKKHFVWKQWAGASQYKAAKDRGYQRWGYYTADIIAKLDDFADRFDILGVPSAATDSQVKQFVSKGKPVIVWEVHNRSMRDRMQRLGVQGMMCSNVPYVTTATPAKTDTFASGLRAAGDLPWLVSDDWSYQPEFDILTSAITIKKKGIQSYILGSMCPVTADDYTLTFEVRWPTKLPLDSQHVGIAFGQPDDSPYLVRIASPVPGYHLVLRSNGMLELFARAANEVSGTQLAAVPTTKPRPGAWMTLNVRVTPDRVQASRKGKDTWLLDVDHSHYRGGYFSLGKNYAEGPAVQFRAVTVS